MKTMCLHVVKIVSNTERSAIVDNTAGSEICY